MRVWTEARVKGIPEPGDPWDDGDTIRVEFGDALVKYAGVEYIYLDPERVVMVEIYPGSGRKIVEIGRMDPIRDWLEMNARIAERED